MEKKKIELLIFLYNKRAINVNAGKEIDEIISSFSSKKISKTSFFNLIKSLESFKLIQSIRREKTIYFLTDYGIFLVNIYLKKYLKK